MYLLQVFSGAIIPSAKLAVLRHANIQFNTGVWGGTISNHHRKCFWMSGVLLHRKYQVAEHEKCMDMKFSILQFLDAVTG